jgi:AmmeMemoRadiSam system protein B
MVEKTKPAARWNQMLIGLCLLWAGACGRQKAEPAQTTAHVGPSPQASSQPRVHNLRVREPAVAGGFYPADAASLGKTIDDMLGQAKARNLKGLRALVSPHAGYQYSGPVAASGFKQLVGQGFERVVVMGPSHHVLFSGVALPDVDALRTPLGDIMISPWGRELARQSPFVVDSTPHAREHSVEVELPFLQKVLGRFEVLPLVFGEVDEQVVAKKISAGLDAKTLIVASSDLSHYYTYEKAQALDRATVDAILRLDVATMSRREACGKSPILALLHIARERGWKAELLDARNSGDTAGDRTRVVGYASVAFIEGNP